MKTVKLNFEKWSRGANNSARLSRIYNRVYFKGYIWTPIVVVNWGILSKTN